MHFSHLGLIMFFITAKPTRCHDVSMACERLVTVQLGDGLATRLISSISAPPAIRSANPFIQHHSVLLVPFCFNSKRVPLPSRQRGLLVRFICRLGCCGRFRHLPQGGRRVNRHTPVSVSTQTEHRSASQLQLGKLVSLKAVHSGTSERIPFARLR